MRDAGERMRDEAGSDEGEVEDVRWKMLDERCKK
jgi:hypothetical protein